MITNRPHRLPGVSYIGFQRYFVTTCTAHRKQAFASAMTVESALLHLRHCAKTFEFDLIAYCFMPDHLHLLIEARSERADATRFVKQFKQLTGYAYKRQHGESLWQPGYHERILRDDEVTIAVVRYILENPVRGGLAGGLWEYPFAGSDVYDREALLSAWTA